MSEPISNEALSIHIDYMKDSIDKLLSSSNNIERQLDEINKKIKKFDNHIENHDDIVIEIIESFLDDKDGVEKIEKIVDGFLNKKTIKKVGIFKSEIITGTRVILASLTIAVILYILEIKK